MSSIFLDSAKAYARLFNWRVIPLHSVQNGKCTCGKPDCKSPGKHPRTRNGLKEASNEKAQIEKWWTQWPEANIGIATGQESGITVLDVDPKHGGDEKLLDLIMEHGAIPLTPEVITGSGGTHLYFAHVPNLRNSASKVGYGIDVRGDGGYVVAPPSNHISGHSYEWEITSKPHELSLAAMPDWMIKLAQSDSDPTASTVSAEQIEPGYKGDSRTVSKQTLDFLTFGADIGQQRWRAIAAARNLLATDMPPVEIVKRLWSVMQSMPQDPERPWSEGDVQAIVDSLINTPPQPLPLRNEMDRRAQAKRREVEILFCATMLVDQNVAIAKAGFLQPRNLLSADLRAYWTRVKQGENAHSVASDCGVLAELLGWTALVKPEESDQYAQNILDAEYLRSVQKNLSVLTSSVSTANAHQARETIGSLNQLSTGLVSGKGVMSTDDALDGLIDVVLNPGKKLIKSGLPNYDEKWGGLERKTLTISAARPGMGKTTFWFQVARLVAKAGHTALFFSLEMPTVNLWGKLIAGGLGYEWRDVVDSESSLDGRARAKIALAVERAKDEFANRLLVDDQANTLENIWRKVAQVQPDVIMVDHLRLVGGNYNVPETQRLGLHSKALKDLAKEFNASVICLHQLSRANEARDNKIPQLRDLRQSGEIEEDADAVIFIHRDDYYGGVQEYTELPSDISETILVGAKVRYGSPNTATYYDFDKKKQMFIPKNVVSFNREIV